MGVGDAMTKSVFDSMGINAGGVIVGVADDGTGVTVWLGVTANVGDRDARAVNVGPGVGVAEGVALGVNTTRVGVTVQLAKKTQEVEVAMLVGLGGRTVSDGSELGVITDIDVGVAAGGEVGVGVAVQALTCSQVKVAVASGVMVTTAVGRLAV